MAPCLLHKLFVPKNSFIILFSMPKKGSNQKLLSRSILICSVVALTLSFQAANLPSELLLLQRTLSFCFTVRIYPLVNKNIIDVPVCPIQTLFCKKDENFSAKEVLGSIPGQEGGCSV